MFFTCFLFPKLPEFVTSFMKLQALSFSFSFKFSLLTFQHFHYTFSFPLNVLIFNLLIKFRYNFSILKYSFTAVWVHCKLLLSFFYFFFIYQISLQFLSTFYINLFLAFLYSSFLCRLPYYFVLVNLYQFLLNATSIVSSSLFSKTNYLLSFSFTSIYVQPLLSLLFPCT